MGQDKLALGVRCKLYRLETNQYILNIQYIYPIYLYLENQDKAFVINSAEGRC